MSTKEDTYMVEVAAQPSAMSTKEDSVEVAAKEQAVENEMSIESAAPPGPVPAWFLVAVVNIYLLFFFKAALRFFFVGGGGQQESHTPR